MPRQSERQKSANELIEALYVQLILETFAGPCDTDTDSDSDPDSDSSMSSVDSDTSSGDSLSTSSLEYDDGVKHTLLDSLALLYQDRYQEE